MVETGLSGFYKIAVTVLKTGYHKLEPKIIKPRKYKDFSSDRFREALINELSKIDIDKKDQELTHFLGACREALGSFRENSTPFMNKNPQQRDHEDVKTEK